MKRIRAACLEQTIQFLLKDGTASEADKQVRMEYEAYKAKLERSRTPFKIIEESEQPDGSLLVKIKRQNNSQSVGDYLG